MTDSLFLRRGLIAAIAVCLVAGVLAASVVGGDESDDRDTRRVAAGSTTTTVVAPGDASTTSIAGDTTPTTAAGAGVPGDATTPTTAAAAGAPAMPGTTAAPSATTAPPAPGDFAELGPAGDGGAVAMPKPGLYTYSIKGGESDETGTTRYEDKGAAAAGHQFVVTIKGMGLDSTSDVVWGASDVRVLRTTIAFGGQSVRCDWEPDHIELEIPLAKNTQWSSSSSCTIGTAVVKRSASTTVIDARRVRVAGEELAVWVLEGTETIDVNGQVQEAKSTTWFSGARGIIVRSVVESSQGSRTSTITSLSPSA